MSIQKIYNSYLVSERLGLNRVVKDVCIAYIEDAYTKCNIFVNKKTYLYDVDNKYTRKEMICLMHNLPFIIN